MLIVLNWASLEALVGAQNGVLILLTLSQTWGPGLGISCVCIDARPNHRESGMICCTCDTCNIKNLFIFLHKVLNTIIMINAFNITYYCSVAMFVHIDSESFEYTQ